MTICTMLANTKMEAFEFYDTVVATASREDVLFTAQALSACDLKWIHLLRGSKT
jgi:hypothetical protein